MRVVQAIAEILRREGVESVSCFPSNPLIDAVAAVGIRPIVCRQERAGVGIADGFSRITNGRKVSVFIMQYGPGSENAYAGVASAYSDSVPILLLPLGHSRTRTNVFPHFSSPRNFAGVTKWAEDIRVPGQVTDVMRRALSYLKMGRPGPVMVEIPVDLAGEEVSDDPVMSYRPTSPSYSGGDPADVERAAKAIVSAANPIIVAGQGVLYAQASPELLEFAELVSAPVMTTLEGKSAFPEDHALSLGSGAMSTTEAVTRFLEKADLVIAVGASLTLHGGGMGIQVPPGKAIVQVTNDWRDMNKDYRVEYPITGDARLVLRQLVKALRASPADAVIRDSVREEVHQIRERWLTSWKPKLTSAEVPINPYRIVWEFMKTVDPRDAIVTHDSGSIRDTLVPFYVAVTPRGYIGWGKSHALGTGLGLTIGAKLAAPTKFCANFMGDGAFGMTGMDFETAVRSKLPITTIVLNNSMMADNSMKISHDRYGIKYLGGNYSEMAKAMGGYAERITEPAEISAAIARAVKANAQGQAVLLEFITREEKTFSEPQPYRTYSA